MAITSCLQGGTGNALFQYAFGLACARRLNVELQLDTSRCKSNLRQYNLNLFPAITEKIVERSQPTVCETQFNYDQKLVDCIKDGDVIIGNFQSEKYFWPVEKEIRERFKPRFPVDYKLEAELKAQDTLMLGIRRTDYVEKQDYHGVLSLDYYKKALSFFNNPKIFVFSDDPLWCLEGLKDLGYPFRIVGSFNQTTPDRLGDEDQDIYYGSLCQNAVIANSTYHWWQAYLGNYNKTVIAPSKWFTNTTIDSRDVVPARWQMI